jgi:IclR family transcriptional regulator, acetate operon repressor
VAVLGKALDLVEALAEAGCLGLGDLSRRTDVNRTAVFRIMTTLVGRGYVVRDPDKRVYRPGPKLLATSAAFLSGSGFIQFAHPTLQALSAELGETVNIGVLNGSEVLYLDMVEGAQGLRMAARVGSRDPVHSTAIGKVLLAFLPSEDLHNRMRANRWEPRTPRTLKTLEALLRELRLVRRRGFAIDDAENERGMRCLGVPIRDGSARVIAALSVSGPAARLPRSGWPGIVRRLRVAAQAIEARMGNDERAARQVPARPGSSRLASGTK